MVTVSLTLILQLRVFNVDIDCKNRCITYQNVSTWASPLHPCCAIALDSNSSCGLLLFYSQTNSVKSPWWLLLQKTLVKPRKLCEGLNIEWSSAKNAVQPIHSLTTEVMTTLFLQLAPEWLFHLTIEGRIPSSWLNETGKGGWSLYFRGWI